MNFKRNQKYLIALVIGLVLVVLLAVVITLASGHKCSLSDQHPTVDSTVYMNSRDNLARVGFSGFIKYEQDTEDNNTTTQAGFMKLKLRKIEQQVDSNATNLLLKTDCAQVTFSISTADKNNNMLYLIKLNLVKPNGQWKECEIDMAIVYDTSRHYKCDKIQEFFCWTNEAKKKKVRIATFAMNAIEFEFNGDPKVIAQDQFSTKSTSFCF